MCTFANVHTRSAGISFALLSCLLLPLLPGCTSNRVPASPIRPAELWIDLIRGEEVGHGAVIDDLATAGAIYVGETHTSARHHAVQLSLLQDLFSRKIPLTLCLEQLEARDQPVVERYNRREIDFATLARELDWAAKWTNYPDYRALCDFARQHGIPVVGINAPADVIRAVNRGGGVAALSPAQRDQLPPDLTIDDPLYERVTTRQLALHMAMDPARLRPMFEAQIARDEVMAANVVTARRRDAGVTRTAFVVLGAGHMRHGLGTPSGVRRREPEIVDRLVLVSDSGHRFSGDTRISHAELRALNRPVADYLRLLPLSRVPLPPGHPPIGNRNPETPRSAELSVAAGQRGPLPRRPEAISSGTPD